MDIAHELRGDDALVGGGVRHAALADPDRTFIHRGSDDQHISYGTFEDLVARVAHGLVNLGAQPGDRVCVFTRCPYTAVTAMFASWHAGLVYSPVNFSLRGGPLSHQVSDAAPAIIVCEDALVDPLLANRPALAAPPRLVVQGDAVPTPETWHAPTWAELEATPSRVAPVPRTPFDVANIFYTSGTTGRPKGVVQPYRWMNQYTFLLRRMLTADDVVYNDLPLYHVGGAVANVARTAWAGATISLWERFSPSDFWSRIARSQATLAILLDVMIPWLLKAPPSDADRANTLNKVHMQPLPLYHREVAQRFGIDWVLSGFGQTETGSVCAGLIDECAGGLGTPPDLYRGRSRDELQRLFGGCGLPVVDGAAVTRKGFMGRPAPYFDVAVVDGDDEPCADGEQGELVVRPRLPGLLLREYFGRPEATVSALRNLWFHTGDIVTCEPDGTFYFVDREGHRIRTRGENVSSLQLEDLLNAMPDVAMTAVLPVPAADGLEHDIAAFVVPVPGAEVDADAVHAWAKEHLPKFMRPRHVRIVSDLPRTPTNKVEKYQLRATLLTEIGVA
jgi:carnitine-CoA ligase